MKLKFASGHVALRVTLDQMRELVRAGQLAEGIPLSGGVMHVMVNIVDEDVANMRFDPNSSSIGFVFPRAAVETELEKPTRNGIGGYFDQGVFSLAIDMHDVRKNAREQD